MGRRMIGLGILVCVMFGLAACGDDANEGDAGAGDGGADDSDAPSPGSSITFSDISATEITASWGRASDDVTASAKLEYKLVKARAPESIDSIGELDDTGDDVEVVQDFTPDLSSKVVTGLAPGTKYFFAVIVRDKSKNPALYEPTSVETLDNSAPVAGSDIAFTDLTGTSVTLKWGVASDDITEQGALEYKVVKATSNQAIDTLGEISTLDSHGIVQNFTAAVTIKEVQGLTSGKTYAFAVVVRDEAGNEALYSPASVTTPDTVAPIAGDAINFANITAHSFTVKWGKATDSVSGQDKLKYKLVRAVTAESVGTLAKTDDAPASNLVFDYTADVDHAELTNLSSSARYYLAVVVEDEAGNKTLYAAAAVTTLDVSAPVVGTALSFDDIATESLSVHWGAATDDLTAAGLLQYKVVRASNVADIDTLGEIEAITSGASLVKDFTASITSAQATGLSGSTEYAFSVVVRDEVGNQAIYTPASRSTLDVIPPALGSAITFSSVGATSLTVSWGEATDDVTAADALQYKLVRAGDAAAIDTLEEADGISGADLILDFTANATTAPLTGLAPTTSYAFGVVVKDGAGNKALFAPETISTLDVSAPAPGNALSFTSVMATSLTVEWGAATDDVTAASDLEYKVVRGASTSAIDSVEEVDAITSGPQLVLDYTANATSAPATGLSSSSTYAFAVVVRDAAGNKAIYSPALQASLDVTAPTIGTAISFASVAATSMTLNWGRASDTVTDQEDLQYKVVGSQDPTDIDSLDEIDTITSGPSLLHDFSADIITLPVAGLSSSTAYSFSVVVRDTSGNQALYGPATQSTVDVIAPTTGVAISFTNTVSTSVTVNWGAASDDITSTSDLSYKIVRAATTAEIDTVLEADAITSGAGLVVTYTPNITSRNATGLTALATYAFAVIVRDAAGNKALYTPATVTTPDGTAPAVGTGIRFSAVSTSGYTLNWGAATDDTTAQAALEYKLVRATSSAAIDTPAEADSVTGGDLLVDWTANTLTKAITGLSAGDFRFYSIVVRDTSLNMAVYTPNSRVAGPILYLSTTATTGGFGGPSAADALCSSARDIRASTDAAVKAVLAQGTTRRACTTANCSNPADNIDWPLIPSTTYYNYDGQVIGTTNPAGIFIFPVMNAAAPGSGYYAFTGLTADWRNTTLNCTDWTDGVVGIDVDVGLPRYADSNMIAAASVRCNALTRLLCTE